MLLLASAIKEGEETNAQKNKQLRFVWEGSTMNTTTSEGGLFIDV